MDIISSCPSCHQPVKPADYFCPNCGKNIHPRPPSTSFSGLLILGLKTILLPPLGFIWGFHYFRQSDNKSKVIGLIVIIVTLIETVWLTHVTISMVNTVNQQVNQQMNLYGL